MLQKLADLLQLVFGCVRRTPLLNYLMKSGVFTKIEAKKHTLK